MDILKFSQLVVFSQYYFYNIFLQKSCRFSLHSYEVRGAKTGSGVGFLRLTAVCFGSAVVLRGTRAHKTAGNRAYLHAGV